MYSESTTAVGVRPMLSLLASGANHAKWLTSIIITIESRHNTTINIDRFGSIRIKSMQCRTYLFINHPLVHEPFFIFKCVIAGFYR